MNDKNEFTRPEIVIDPDMEVDDTGTITAYIETWFDVDAKFGTHTSDSDSEWLNLYAEYTPKTNTLKMMYQLDRDDGSEFFDYTTTNAEAQLVKDMINECCQKYHGCTAAEYAADIEITGGMEGLS